MYDSLEASLPIFLKALQEESDPLLSAMMYLRCIERAMPLQLEDRHPAPIPLTSITLDGLEIFFAQPIEDVRDKLAERRKALCEAVDKFEKPKDIPEDVIDEIALAWRARLDLEFWLLHFENPASGIPKPLTEALRARIHAVELEVVQMPRPPQVAERLRALSRIFHLEGNHLFPYWRCDSDMEAAMHAMRDPEYSQEEEGPSDWDTAQESYRERALVALQRRLIIPNVPSLEDVWDRWLKYLYDAPAVAVNWIIEQVPDLSTWTPQLELAAASIPEGAEAIYPVPALQAGKATLEVKSLGTDMDGSWTIEAFTKPYVRPGLLPGGHQLTRLSIRSRQDQSILDSAFSDGQRWILHVRLRDTFGLSLLVGLSSDLRDKVLGELLSKAPNELFDWILGTETSPDNNHSDYNKDGT